MQKKRYEQETKAQALQKKIKARRKAITLDETLNLSMIKKIRSKIMKDTHWWHNVLNSFTRTWPDDLQWCVILKKNGEEIPDFQFHNSGEYERCFVHIDADVIDMDDVAFWRPMK